jgi:phosphatidylserine/phosphatidylglycerophosphate/cardiolipin synthase-like enzyme
MTLFRPSLRLSSLVIFFLLLCGAAVLFFQGKPRRETLAPLPQDPQVQVYFNHNLASDYEDPYRNFRRSGDNLEAEIIKQINQAQNSIDMAVMELRLPYLAEALIKQHKKGVKVRLIVDNKYNKTRAEYTPQDIAKMNDHERRTYEELLRYPADALDLLKTAGIALQDDTYKGTTKGSGIMHHKFIIIDKKNIVISSGNFTTSEFHGDFNNKQTRGNPNNLVVVKNHPQIAQEFSKEFNYMWSGLFKSKKPDRLPNTFRVGQGTMTIYFSSLSRRSPIEQTGSGLIASWLKQAQFSIHIAVFVFSDPYISTALEQSAQQKQKDIKVLIDPDFYRPSYSSAYGILGVCHPEEKSPHRTWSKPLTNVGYPVGIEGDRGVHSKMAVLDGRVVVTGSQNWSVAGNYRNDETLVAIANPVVARHYEREFNRLYSKAVVGLKSLPQAQKCN